MYAIRWHYRLGLVVDAIHPIPEKMEVGPAFRPIKDYIISTEIGKYLIHSDEANCRLELRGTSYHLVTLRDIRKNEALSLDFKLLSPEIQKFFDYENK